MGYAPGRGAARRAEREAKRRAEENLKSRLPERQCRQHQRGLSQNSGECSPAKSTANKYQQWEKEKREMLANGWCLHQVRHLSMKYDMKTFSYLAKLERSSSRDVDHDRCTAHETCIAYNTDPITYKSRHTTADCTCRMVTVPYDKLISIVRRGRIPLVSIESFSPGWTPRLRVAARSRTSAYVAISHVWADGLGNPRENGLPSCQIERLKHSLRAIREVHQSSSWFWMDTLCIPVGPDESALRLTQIDSMASVYKDASCSLVLDAELMSTVCCPDTVTPRGSSTGYWPHCTGTSPQPFYTTLASVGVEAHARLICSVWMTRSWTLQEGQLPPNIAVQFKNKLVSLGRVSKACGQYTERLVSTDVDIATSLRQPGLTYSTPIEISDESTVQDQSVSDDIEMTETVPLSDRECECADIALQRNLYDTFFADSAWSDLTRKFPSVWDELAGRSTTMARDVPLIMTNMLDLVGRRLLIMDSAEQMFQTILLSLNRMPMSIFFNTGPRQDQDDDHQNRWVPTKIGAFGLASSKQSLKICRTYLEYDFSCQAEDQDVAVFITKVLLPFKAETRISFLTPGSVYTVQPSVAERDRFTIEGFALTCVIVDVSSLGGPDDFVRAACFFGREAKRNSIRHLWRRLKRCRGGNTGSLDMDLTFYCPLRMRMIASGSDTAMISTPVHALSPVETACNLRIRYDPVPGFKRLEMRSEFGYESIVFLFCILIIVGIFVALGERLGFGEALVIGIILAGTVGPTIALGLIYGCIPAAAIPLEYWSYVRSFRMIRRQQSGMV